MSDHIEPRDDLRALGVVIEQVGRDEAGGLHHQIAVWALKRPLTYAARTDEFTFAHDIK